jgi:hypothetical protein
MIGAFNASVKLTGCHRSFPRVTRHTFLGGPILCGLKLPVQVKDGGVAERPLPLRVQYSQASATT